MIFLFIAVAYFGAFYSVCARVDTDFHLHFSCSHQGISFGYEMDILIDMPPPKDVKGKTAIIPTADGGYVEVDVEWAMGLRRPYFAIEHDVFYELYTRRNPEVPYLLNMSDPNSMRSSPFNGAHRTRIAVHGWRSFGEMRELLSDGEYRTYLIGASPIF